MTTTTSFLQPETFLHPRHAKLIGQYLAEHTRQDGQLFVATHSEEVLQGILDSRTQRGVKVFRLDRTDGTHPVLEPECVRSLWAKPMFRYSRLLSGLFHRGVVICEADSDARFYEVHFDELFIDTTDHDLSFTHLDGWKRFDQALGELRKLSIPSVVICDIDVLQNNVELTRLVKAAGGDFARIEAQVQVVQEYVEQLPVEPGMKNWQRMKRNALSTLGTGYARQAIVEALDYLKKIGIFVVPVGELEAWYQLRCRKSQVVPQVLEMQLYKNRLSNSPSSWQTWPGSSGYRYHPGRNMIPGHSLRYSFRYGNHSCGEGLIALRDIKIRVAGFREGAVARWQF